MCEVELQHVKRKQQEIFPKLNSDGSHLSNSVRESTITKFF